MSVLRSIEHKIESLFEGVFGRAFRTHVQPVELARKLVKEMDDHRTVSVSRVYVPNEYSIYLSSADRDQFSGYETSLLGELQDYLAEHARRERYVLHSTPAVIFHTDTDLQVGEFGIATRLVPKADAEAGSPPAEAEPAATMIYRPRAEKQAGVPAPVVREVVTLAIGGQSHELVKRRIVIGRARDCDIRISDPNVSRRHAEIQHEGAAYWLVDLGSTNGIEVDGHRQKRVKLENGTRFTIGSTDGVFSRELQ